MSFFPDRPYSAWCFTVGAVYDRPVFVYTPRAMTVFSFNNLSAFPR